MANHNISTFRQSENEKHAQTQFFDMCRIFKQRKEADGSERSERQQNSALWLKHSNMRHARGVGEENPTLSINKYI